MNKKPSIQKKTNKPLPSSNAIPGINAPLDPTDVLSFTITAQEVDYLINQMIENNIGVKAFILFEQKVNQAREAFLKSKEKPINPTGNPGDKTNDVIPG